MKRPRRITTILVGFGCMIALIVAMGLQVRPFTYLWVSVYTAFAVAVLVVGLNARLESQYREEHRRALAAQEDLRRLSQRLVSSQEQERQALSRELHDQVGQALTAIKIDVSRVEQSLGPSQADLVERLHRARQGAEDTLAIIRRLSMLLRPSMLDDIGLSAALGWYARQFSENTGIRVNLTDDGSADRLPEAHKTGLYRVVQEALTNCARHAEARSVQIHLAPEEDGYVLSIEDDGKGFVPGEHPRGLGLIGMQERIDGMQGSLDLDSAPGAGTRLRVRIPQSGVPAPSGQTTAAIL
ncbi:MAG: sensor histidine kinase [Acidobacteria bacterium]|nr:sensor histidine kinase [Acidobacteriota bacterium]